MIDIWMLFTMTVPFLEVVLHTTNEAFKRPRTTNMVDVIRVQSTEEEEEKGVPQTNISLSSTFVRLTGRLMLPISSLLFTLIFWVVGLIASYFSDANLDPNMTDCLTIDLK